MAIPKITNQDILEAMKYIDANGTPTSNLSYKYELVAEDGKRYAPKYVIAVADHLANGSEISTGSYNAIEAKNFLTSRGFTVEIKKFTLCITADKVESTDKRFTMDKLSLGDDKKPLDTYLEKADGTIIRRTYNRNEQKISNQTMPRIACQVFEKQLAALPADEKAAFPICQYNRNSEMIRGIYPDVDEFRKHRNTIEYLTYGYDNGRQFVLYCWNIFSTIYFVQECLKRFGGQGDRFILIYREKDEKEAAAAAEAAETQAEAPDPEVGSYRHPYSYVLAEAKNIILRGAPGTGKSYLAKEIAADIVSNGQCENYAQLDDEQKKQVEFVQFHPSYDYSDFVEGLRPRMKQDGTMGFELRDGIFKSFVGRARKNFENYQETGEGAALKNYVFIIDEINRGEISKIFGELFFAIDPGYRGRAGEVSTQYANLHTDPEEKFYIPENVYIIGTMNDIDRSVDTFDFAMRRRFRFVEIKADERLEMLDAISDMKVREEAIRRMKQLNEAIAKDDDLGENYQIGAAYFLKLKTLTFDELWSDHLQPLLQEYVRGMYNDTEKMSKFEKAYKEQASLGKDASDGAVQD